MSEIHKFPSLSFRLVGDPAGDEPPAELTIQQAHVLMKRAIENLDDLFSLFAGSETTHTSSAQENTPSAEKDDAGDNVGDVADEDTPTGDAPRQTPMEVEVSWDVDNSVLSEEAQTAVTLLVGAGIIMSLKDYLRELQAQEQRS